MIARMISVLLLIMIRMVMLLQPILNIPMIMLVIAIINMVMMLLVACMIIMVMRAIVMLCILGMHLRVNLITICRSYNTKHDSAEHSGRRVGTNKKLDTQTIVISLFMIAFALIMTRTCVTCCQFW